MLFAVMAPTAFAADAKVKDMTPIVYIRGNGEPLYDENGDRIPAEEVVKHRGLSPVLFASLVILDRK